MANYITNTIEGIRGLGTIPKVLVQQPVKFLFNEEQSNYSVRGFVTYNAIFAGVITAFFKYAANFPTNDFLYFCSKHSFKLALLCSAANGLFTQGYETDLYQQKQLTKQPDEDFTARKYFVATVNGLASTMFFIYTLEYFLQKNPQWFPDLLPKYSVALSIGMQLASALCIDLIMSKREEIREAMPEGQVEKSQLGSKKIVYKPIGNRILELEDKIIDSSPIGLFI